MVISGTNGFVVSVPGVYNYAFSIQFRNTDSDDHQVLVWLRVNGVNVPWSASYTAVSRKHGTTNGVTIMAANFLLELYPQDQVDLWWQTEDLTVSIHAIAAAGSVPGAPSIAASLTYVSSLP